MSVLEIISESMSDAYAEHVNIEKAVNAVKKEYKDIDIDEKILIGMWYGIDAHVYKNE